MLGATPEKLHFQCWLHSS